MSLVSTEPDRRLFPVTRDAIRLALDGELELAVYVLTTELEYRLLSIELPRSGIVRPRIRPLRLAVSRVAIGFEERPR